MKPTQRSQKDSACSRSRAEPLPEVPPPPAAASAAPSELRELVLKSRCYPRLMQEASWTLAAPFKEQSYHRSPSDSIANNYTPTAQDLKLKNLHILKSSSMARTSPGSAEQKTVSPSLKESAPSRKRLKTAQRSPRGSDSSTPVLHSLDLVSLRAAARRPELSAIYYTDNQPLTPEEQFVVMHLHEQEMNKREKTPSGNDIERYCYYIHNGVREDMLAPQDEEVINVILKQIPAHILANPCLENSLVSLKEEIKEDYHISLMKAIVDYILMDPAERERLLIGSIPRPFPQRVIRAPIPWHSSYKEVKSWNESNLFIVNPLMHALHQLWLSEYSCLRFVRTEEILGGDLPLLPAEFVDTIRRHCVEAHDVLLNKWIPTCASILLDEKRKWLHFAPGNDCDSPQQIESYFSSVATLMSLQLCQMVVSSLEDLLALFMIHEDGSDFAEPYQEMQFFLPQILIVKLSVEEPKIVFEPPLKGCWDLISLCFREILQGAEELPKVERLLFPQLKRDDLALSTVKPGELVFAEYINKIEKIFESNTLGPRRYLNAYRKYSHLLNSNAQQDVTDFLNTGPSLGALREKIDSLTELKREIASMRVTVPLAMFCLDAAQLNEELCIRTQNLRDALIEFEVTENRELNKRICEEYNSIANRLSKLPLNTEELVELDAYLKKSSRVTASKLRRDVSEATYRLQFLMDYADLSSMSQFQTVTVSI